uniref:BTB domain-containing protein n=1 Tax=Panagrolaimus davidi TaxID=227884 RepID=A0A914QVC3_9BILA
MATGPRSLNNTLEGIYFSKKDADVTFIVHGNEIKAHKFILVNRSPVFKAMLEGPMAPEDQRHLINDPKVNPDEFDDFLYFLYTDRLNILKDEFKGMIHLGHFYQVPFLIEKCTDKIFSFFQTAEDAFEVAEIGREYLPETTELLEKCLQHLYNNYLDEQTTFSYWAPDGRRKWISTGLVIELIKKSPQDGRNNEDIMLKNVIEWCKDVHIQENNEQQPTIENVQAKMAPLMQYFHLSKFTPLTLATTFQVYKLISDEQLSRLLSEQTIQIFANNSTIGTGVNDRGGRGDGYGYGDYRDRLPPARRIGRGRGGGFAGAPIPDDDWDW